MTTPFLIKTGSTKDFAKSIEQHQASSVSMEARESTETILRTFSMETIEAMPANIQKLAMEQSGSQMLLEHFTQTLTQALEDHKDNVNVESAKKAMDAFDASFAMEPIKEGEADFVNRFCDNLPLDSDAQLLFVQGPDTALSMTELFEDTRKYIIEHGCNINRAGIELLGKVKEAVADGSDTFRFSLPTFFTLRTDEQEIDSVVGPDRFVWKSYPQMFSNFTDWVDAGLTQGRPKLFDGNIPALEPESVQQFIKAAPLTVSIYDKKAIVDDIFSPDNCWIERKGEMIEAVKTVLMDESINVEFKSNYVNSVLYRVQNLLNNQQAIAAMLVGYGQGLQVLSDAIDGYRRVVK